MERSAVQRNLVERSAVQRWIGGAIHDNATPIDFALPRCCAKAIYFNASSPFTPSKSMIKTFDQAYRFVLKEKVVTVFGSKGSAHPSLWDNTGLSETKPKAGGWSPKVKAVWDWKTRIPQTYPDKVFYGKIPGGDAVLMEMRHFQETHYPCAFEPVENLDALPQDIYKLIRSEPNFTGPLRKQAVARFGCTKSQFDTALRKLQISLNIVRSNDPSMKNDFWLAMRDVHLETVRRHES